jgi:GNAT superfamily N-acetyltransferase
MGVNASEYSGDGWTVEQQRYDSDEVAELVEELQGEYVVRYGGRDETPMDPDAFWAPFGSFRVVRTSDMIVACGGIRRRSADEAEIKRMYVRSAYRARGFARLLLARLEDDAIAIGYRRLVLETGAKQPEALALYESAGYTPVPSFGFHRDSPLSRCLAKDLVRS